MPCKRARAKFSSGTGLLLPFARKSNKINAIEIIDYCEVRPIFWINRDVIGFFLIFNDHKELLGFTPVGDLIEKY